MLIHIVIIILVVQVISILFTGLFGIYNTILMISQFPVQIFTSLISFFLYLHIFYLQENMKK